MKVELALGGNGYAFPGDGAEPAVVKVGVGEHQEALLAAFGQVHAPGSRRAPDDANGRLDRVDVGVDDGRVEVATAAVDSPRSVGVAMELEEVRAGGPSDESTWPLGTLGGAAGGLVGEKRMLMNQVLALTKTRPDLLP